jgi:hypothetical protein
LKIIHKIENCSDTVIDKWKFIYIIRFIGHLEANKKVGRNKMNKKETNGSKKKRRGRRRRRRKELRLCIVNA